MHGVGGDENSLRFLIDYEENTQVFGSIYDR